MEQDQRKVSAFGYELIRDHVLSTILGKHEEDILYWAGKDLARKFPLFSMEETPSFFAEAGWGILELEKLSKSEAYYILTGEPEVLKIGDRCFRLEAGFLAEQHQKTSGYLTECFEEKNAKRNHIRFHVKWDLKEKV